MQIDSSQLDLFKTCFNGNENAYLTYDAKTGSYKTEHLPLTKKQYKEHLEGKISLGVFPIRNNKCNFGVIDDDFHHKSKKYNYQRLLDRVSLFDLPVNVFKSKTGGAHIVVHFFDWYAIKDVRHILKKFAYQLCDGEYEIFPKQDEITKNNKLGNAINLPYHNGNTRVLIDDKGETQNWSMAMSKIPLKLCNLDDLKPFKLLADKKMVEGRNAKLFWAKQFFKKNYPDYYLTKVKELNKTFVEPLSWKEIENTVLKGGDYFNSEEETVSAWRLGMKASEIRETIYEPLPAVVEGLIFSGITFITGKSKLGKSFFALQLAHSVETGGKFLNCQCVKGDVLHYSLEDGRRRNSNRWKTMGINPENAMYQFRDRKPKIPRLTKGLETEIEDWIKHIANPKLVIIDPYVKVKMTLGGSKMNAYENDNYNLQDIYTLANKYNIAIVFLHHTKKKSEDDVFDEMNGSSGIQSNCDSMIVLSSNRKVGQNVVFNCLPKDAEPKEFEVALTPNCTWEYVGKVGQASRTKIKEAIIEAVKMLETGDEGTETGKIKEYVHAINKDWKKDHIGVEITRLTDDGELVKIRKGVYKSANY